MAWSAECKKELDYWERLDECREVIKKYSEKIKGMQNPDEEIKKMYAYAKQVIPEFYIDAYVPCMHPAYKFIRDDLIICEYALEGRFIGDSEPVFDFYDNRQIDDYSSPESILNYIVHNVRRYLVLSHSLNQKRPIDINRLNFENECVVASNKVKELCDQLWLESYVVGVYPGYLKENDLFNGSGFHMCNIVKIEEQYYLIDCSYRQFFTLRQNFLERLGVVQMAGCKPGKFMLMNEERKNVANRVLKNGWTQLDGDVLKHYLDGFTLSFRNGLYYEQTNDFSYSTAYDVDTYIKFLRGEDNQLNHEDREVLGYQKKPLKNHNISF